MRFLNLFLALQHSQVHRKQNSYGPSIAFSSLEVLSVLCLGRFHTTTSLVFYLFIFLGFYSLYLIDLVLSILKSPSLLKSEFGRKSYHRFCKPRFLSSSVRRRRAVRRKFRREFRWRRTARRTVRGRRNLRRTSPNWCSEAFFGGRRTARRMVRRLARRRRTGRRTESFFGPNGHICFDYKRGFFPNGF